MPPPTHPSLYQINTRAWLRRLSDASGRPIGLADVPDSEIDALAERGFDWIWLLRYGTTPMDSFAGGRQTSRLHA